MKKVFNIIKKVFEGIIVIFTIGVVVFTIISVNTFNRNDRSIFGYKAFIVLSDSMSSTDFSAGDLAIVKSVDPMILKEGDIVSYTSHSKDNYGEIVTHKIRKVTQDEQGNPGFITYGTTTGKDDPDMVHYSYVVGKYQSSIPKVGKFFIFLKTVPGYICCIFIPLLILILINGVNSIMIFRQYKREQYEELEAERQKIEAQKVETQQMLMEIKQLKSQLEDKEKNIEDKTQLSQS